MTQTAAVDDVDLTRDRTLVELAQGGNLDAFGELYTRYFRRLVRFSAKRVGDVHEAEEIAQEAFARAYRALPTFAGERRFYPWMTVIASRLCVDTMRRRGRVEVGEITELEFNDAGFERVEFAGDLVTLARAMSGISDRHREVLELRERQGWSYQHIADHYNVSIGTVEALLWRARKALRREFAALGSFVLLLPGMRRLSAAWRHHDQAQATSMFGVIGTVAALGLAGGFVSAAPSGQAVVALASSVAPRQLVPAAVTVAQPIAAPAPKTGATPGARQPQAVVPSSTSSTGVVARIGPVTVLSSSAASARAEQEPIKSNIGPVLVGANPGDPHATLTHVLGMVTTLSGGR